MFAALLDTSVLWPSLQRDFLLSLAVQNLYRPLWSTAILDELRRTEVEKLIRRDVDRESAQDRAGHLIGQMTAHFDDAIVAGWEPLVGRFGLPDPDDEHVAAAAVIGGAGVIVTSNLKHFPTEKVPCKVLAPAVFAADTVAVSPDDALVALQEIARRSRRPVRTPATVLADLEHRYAMYEVAEIIRSETSIQS